MESVIDYFQKNPALTLGIIIFVLFIVIMIFKNIKYLLLAAIVGIIGYYMIHKGYFKKENLENIKIEEIKKDLESVKKSTKEKIINKLLDE